MFIAEILNGVPREELVKRRFMKQLVKLVPTFVERHRFIGILSNAVFIGRYSKGLYTSVRQYTNPNDESVEMSASKQRRLPDIRPLQAATSF